MKQRKKSNSTPKLTNKARLRVKREKIKNPSVSAVPTIDSEKPKTFLTLKPYLVAIIDILGFSATLKNVTSQSLLESAYAKIRRLQEEFRHPAASRHPDKQLAINAQYGRCVSALSDAIVVAFTPHCPMKPTSGISDLFKMFFYDLVLAQNSCIEDGVFVRGAISYGPYYFEDDVLLSPALSIAHEIETSYTINPIIVMPESVREKIIEVSLSDPLYQPDDPIEDYFVKYGKRHWRGEQLYFLNYLGIMINEVGMPLSEKERQIIRAAQLQHREKLVKAVWDRNTFRTAASFLRFHRQKIENAFCHAQDNKVRRKYLWLMRYHNRFCRKKYPFIRNQKVDLSKFCLPKRAKRNMNTQELIV